MPAEVWERQRAAMAERGLDALVAISPENVAWTCGVMVPSQRIVRHRHAICLVPRAGEPEMIVVDIEEGLVRASADIARVTAYNEFTEKPVALLAERIRERGLAGGRIGVELDYLPARDHQLLVDGLPGTRVEGADDLFAALRMIKSPAEIERLRTIGRIAERVGYEALHRWRPGTTEADIARWIAEAYTDAGGEKLTMLAVGAGERSAFLNAVPTRRQVRPGEIVRIDVIGTMGNYYSDVARTAVAGRAAPELKATWRKLVDARDLALEMIRPGASAQQIYRRYIERMDAWGLPTLHFLGHGLGLTLHEEPYLNRYADCTLREGMVLAVEPLCVFPDWGLQLEEEVIVTRDGCEVITDRFDATELWEVG